MVKIKWLSNNLGLVSVLVLSFFPSLLWFSTQPVALKFSNASLTLTSLGQITGLVGMAMISVAIILSARTAFMDKLFNGLDNLYKIHRGTGIASFVFLLIHPLTLALSYTLFSKQSATLFLLPGGDLAKDLGILALLLMMILLVITAFSKIKYQVMKFSHKFFGAVFFSSVLHTLFVQSGVSRNPFIHWYMLGLMAIGLVAFSYKTLLGKILVEKYIYSVKEVNPMRCKTTEVVMSPVGKQMKYFPGQFIFVSFSNSNISSESHPFSIASAPFEPELRILVKALGDYTSSQIPKLQVGAKAEIEGPCGSFNHSKAESKNQIWIAGGAGIAPFIGMAKDIKNVKGYDVDFYACANTKNDIVSLNELSKMTTESDNFRFIPFCQDEKGYLDAEKIMKLSGTLEGKDIFLCGPPPMVKNLKGQFEKIIQKNKKFCPVTLLKLKKNYGRSIARNLGLLHAKNEIIVFLDEDVVVPKDFLAIHLLRHEFLDKCIIVGLRQNINPKELKTKLNDSKQKIIKLPDFNEDFRFKKFIPAEWQKTHKTLPANNFNKICYPLKESDYFKKFGSGKIFGVWGLPSMLLTCNVSVPKNEIIKIGGFDSRFKGWGMEDTHLAAKLIANGLYLIPNLHSTVYHLIDDNRQKYASKKLKEYEKNFKFYNDLKKENLIIFDEEKWKGKMRKFFTNKYTINKL